ncbi:hypothetical protein D3C81_2168720 [compost metagenome]
MDLGSHKPADGRRAPHFVITQVERLVAVRQPGFLNALVECVQRVGDVAVGAGEVIGLLVAGAADEEGNGSAVPSRYRIGNLY